MKKLTSTILILVLMLLPFINLLNVKAEAVQISVDNNTTKSDDPNSKKVTNTTKLSIKDDEIGTDSFKAYKVLDIYYNETSNQMSYDFTSTFADFKLSSYAKTTTKDFSSLTINDYLAYGEEGANQNEFNLLAAQFAKYVKKNNTAGLDFTYQEGDSTEGYRTLTENIEVGAYLILATTNNPFFNADGEEKVNTYGALIANIVFTIQNGNWNLDKVKIIAKSSDNANQSFVLDCEPTKLIELMNSEEDITFVSSFYKDKEYTYLLSVGSDSNEYVTDNSSWKVEITFPEGINYNDIYTFFDADEGKIYPVVNNKLYHGDKVIADITTNGKTITITSPTNDLNFVALAVGVKLSDTPVLGEAGNTIKAETTYVTDPYSDPAGTTTLTSENKIITYGLQITNKDGDTNLSGGVFGLYTDSTCSDSSKIGEVTVTNGVGTFSGVTDGDLYVKQITAPSGYKLSTDIAHITIDTASLSSEGYYPLEVTNAKQGLLPSTGGLGTILYTTFGLLIIALGSLAFISYRKRAQSN